MKFVVAADHFVRKEYYEELFKKHPEHELIVVQYGSEDRIVMRDMFREVEENGPDAVAIPEELYEAVEDADLLMTHLCPIPSSLIARGKRLRAILTNRGGLENIAVEAATERKIPILNNPAHNANAVAEMTVGLMIAESRNTVRSYYGLKQGEWRENYSNFGNIWEIKGKTVGIIGFSTIGRLVAEKLSSFGCRIIANDIKYDPEDELIKRLSIEMVDLPTLLAESDYVTLHARADGCILNKEMLSLMKPTAIFINTARAYMVDYDALYELLRDKKILGAAIDVFPFEPLGLDYPFLALDNVTLTSHRAGDTVNAYSDSPEMLLNDYALYLEGKRPHFFVNPQVGMGR